ncbi:hypothetical protein FHS14_000622 [Paenibacillus baekrokdamisoli]|nr:hypothetical protein [Paenibacillus baekrokdamisoli]
MGSQRSLEPEPDSSTGGSHFRTLCNEDLITSRKSAQLFRNMGLN